MGISTRPVRISCRQGWNKLGRVISNRTPMNRRILLRSSWVAHHPHFAGETRQVTSSTSRVDLVGGAIRRKVRREVVMRR